MDAASGISAQISQTRLEVAYSALKTNADSQKQIANVLQSAIASVPGSPVKGINVNVKA
jgi:hypothetical protein